MGFNTDLIVGTLVVSMLSFIMVGALFAVATNYDVDVDPELENVFNEYNATQAQFEETQEIIEGGNINPDGSDEAVYKNVIVAGKQMQQQSSIFVSFISKINDYIPIPVTVLAMLSSLVFILVLIGFLTMITKRGP